MRMVRIPEAAVAISQLMGTPVIPVVDALFSLPCSVEAEEVVRCKNCKHHKDGMENDEVWCEHFKKLLDQDFYCAEGEQ